MVLLIAFVQELADANPVASNLRRLRTAQEVTIEGLARSSGVSVRTIKYIESGAGNPRLSIIEALAAALSVPVTDLLTSAA